MPQFFFYISEITITPDMVKSGSIEHTVKLGNCLNVWQTGTAAGQPLHFVSLTKEKASKIKCLRLGLYFGISLIYNITEPGPLYGSILAY